MLDKENPVMSKTMVCEDVSLRYLLSQQDEHTPVSTGGTTISRVDSMT